MAQKHGTQDVYIVAGSEDGKILFWDLQTRHVVKELEGHQGEHVVKRKSQRERRCPTFSTAPSLPSSAPGQ